MSFRQCRHHLLVLPELTLKAPYTKVFIDSLTKAFCPNGQSSELFRVVGGSPGIKWSLFKVFFG